MVNCNDGIQETKISQVLLSKIQRKMNHGKKLLYGAVTTVYLFAQLSSSVLAATQDIPFTNALNYVYDNAKIDISSGIASLIGIPYGDDQDPGEFGAGTGNNVMWNAGGYLKAGASTVGDFVSRVFDGVATNKQWDSLKWIAGLGYGKELPSNGGVESGYGSSNADMSNSVLYMKGNEPVGATSFADSSGQGNNGNCTDCATAGDAGKFNAAPSYDGVNDVTTIADSNSLDLTTDGTISSWVKIEGKDFQYQRPITLSTATTEDVVTVELDFDNTTFDYTKLQDDGADIRFTDSANNVLPYWIEYWKQGTSEESRLWVTIKTAGTSSFTMHYGNADVGQGSSGDDTFLAFNELEGTDYGSDKWDLLSSNSDSYSSGLNYYENGAIVLNGFLSQRVLKTKNYIPARTKVAVDAEYTISEVKGTGTTNPALCNVLYGERWTGTTWVSANDDFFCWNSSTTSTYDKSYGIDVSIQPSGTSTHTRIYDNDPLAANDDVRVSMTVQSGQLDVNVTGDKTYSNSWTGTDTYVAGRYYVGAGFNYGVTQAIHWITARAVDPADPTTSIGAELDQQASVIDGGDWMYERTLDIHGTIPEDNFQIQLLNLSDALGNKVSRDYSDLRIYQASDGQELPYWVGNKGTLQGIWVKVANKNETQLVIKYGNPHATKMKWTGADVFDLFDDFNGDTLSDQWVFSKRRGDEPSLVVKDNSTVALNDGRFWNEMGRFQSGAQNGYYIQLESADSFTGYKALHVRYSSTNNSEGYLCMRYGVDGLYNSIGRLSKQYMSVYRGDSPGGRDGSACPSGIWTTPLDPATDTGVQVTLAPTQSVYSEGNEEFEMAPDGIRRHFYAYGYPDGIGQTTTQNYDQTETGVRTPTDTGKIRINSQGGWYADHTLILDQIVLRKQSALGQEPTFTVNDDEHIVGAGKHGAYGIGISGAKAYIFFGNMQYGVWLNPEWNHISGTLTGGTLSFYLNGAKVGDVTGVTAPSANTSPFELGGFTGGSLPTLQKYAHVAFDELNVQSLALSATQLFNQYARGGISLKFQFRSCDDPACDTEQFVGPDGTSTTYFTELPNQELTPQIIQGPVQNNRYVQYKAFFTGDGMNSPTLYAVELHPDSYPNSNPSLTHAASLRVQGYQTLAGFTETTGTPSTGTARYQISRDNSTWYYWDTGTKTWTLATGATFPAETNTASEINSYIPFFAYQVGTGDLYVKAYFASDGNHSIALDQLTVSYGTTSVAPSTPTTLYINTASAGAQTGNTNPGNLNDANNLVVSSIYADNDIGDLATQYQIQVSTDPNFASGGDVYDSGQTAFTIPVIAGQRTPDITLPNNVFDYNTPYYWRIRYWDAAGNTGAYSPSGGGSAATFTSVDTTSPALSSTQGLQDGDGGVSVSGPLHLIFEDAGTGVDESTLDLTVDGKDAVIDGVCQSGWTCAITNTTNGGKDVVLTPFVPLPELSTVTILYNVDDKSTPGNNLNGSLDITTGAAPVDTSTTIQYGSGGGGSSAYENADPTGTGGTTHPAANDHAAGGSIDDLLNIIPENSLSHRLGYAETTTGGAKDNSSTVTSSGDALGYHEAAGDGSGGTGGEQSGTTQDAISGGQSGGSTTDMGESGDSGAGTMTTSDTPSRPATYEESLCAVVDTSHEYTLPEGTSSLVAAQIQLLKSIGVDFPNGGKPLPLDQGVTRSDLLKYLLQVNCREFDRDITNVKKFADVPETHPNYLYVHIGRKYGYVNGYLHDGLYHPDQQITRAEALKIILEFFAGDKGRRYIDGTLNVFADVAPDEWFSRYVRFAVDKGIIADRGAMFGPYDMITLKDIINRMVTALALREDESLK